MTLLFFTIILAIVAAISSLLDIEKKSKNFRIKNTFIYIFLLGTIVASILQYRESERDKVIAEKKDSAFIKSQSDIIHLQIKNKKESDSLDNIIIALNNQLDGKTGEIMKSSSETLKSQKDYIEYVNGADLPELKILSQTSNRFNIQFFNSSKLPIYDARVIVRDYDSIMEMSPTQIIDNKITFVEHFYNLNSISTEIGTISPYKNVSLKKKYIYGDTHHYMIEFKTLKKYYVYYFIVNQRGDNFNTVYRVYAVQPNDSKLFVKEVYLGTKLWGPMEDHYYTIKKFVYGPTFTEEYWIKKFHINLKHHMLKTPI